MSEFKFAMGQTVYYLDSIGIGRTAEEARQLRVFKGKIFARRANKTKAPTYYVKGDGHYYHYGHSENHLYATEQEAADIANDYNRTRRLI